MNEKINRKDFLKIQAKIIKSELYKSLVYDLTARVQFLYSSNVEEGIIFDDIFDLFDISYNEQLKKCDKIILSKEFFGENLEKKIDFNF